jgi:organic radical activating enzyme
MNKMRFIGVTKDATTAGPGKRLELFLKGCIRGVISPCEGCFNPTTWEFGGSFYPMTTDEVVAMIDRDAWNRQVTFCGGEPLLQTKNLIKVCKQLKEIDPSFHIVIYTAYKVDTLMKHGLEFTWVECKHSYEMQQLLLAYSQAGFEFKSLQENHRTLLIKLFSAEEIKELMQYVDIIVDGDYQADKRLPTERYMNEGMFVGSWNQRVIQAKESAEKGKLVYVHADEYQHDRLLLAEGGHVCTSCGHELMKETVEGFCDEICQYRYEKRQAETAFLK